MVPTAVTTSFEMVQSEVVVQLAILLLDDPSDLNDPDQLVERGGRRQVRHAVLPFGVGQRSLAVELPLVAPALGWSRTDRDRACGKVTFRAAARADTRPMPRRETSGKFAERAVATRSRRRDGQVASNRTFRATLTNGLTSASGGSPSVRGCPRDSGREPPRMPRASSF